MMTNNSLHIFTDSEGVIESESEYESEYESDIALEADPEANSSENNNIIIVDVFRWLLILILTWQIAHCISATAVGKGFVCIRKPNVLIGLSAFPASVYVAHKYLNIDCDNFIAYVLCPKCHTLYDYKKMLKPGSTLTVKRCRFVTFPLHPMKNRRLPCNTPIVRPINLSQPFNKNIVLTQWVPIVNFPRKERYKRENI